MKTFTRSRRALWRQSPWSVFVLAPRPDAEVLALEGSAVAIWELLDTPRSTDDLVAAVAARYDVESATVDADVHAVLERLVALGLVDQE